jgi:hypothetical protein
MHRIPPTSEPAAGIHATRASSLSTATRWNGNARRRHTSPGTCYDRKLDHPGSHSGDLPSESMARRSEAVRYKQVSVAYKSACRDMAGGAERVVSASPVRLSAFRFRLSFPPVLSACHRRPSLGQLGRKS